MLRCDVDQKIHTEKAVFVERTSYIYILTLLPMGGGDFYPTPPEY